MYVNLTAAEILSRMSNTDLSFYLGEYLYCECLDDSQENEHGKKVFPYAAGKTTLGCLRNFCTLPFSLSREGIALSRHILFYSNFNAGNQLYL